eukprot:2206065-Pyramimonas_sp.AAC.2
MDAKGYYYYYGVNAKGYDVDATNKGCDVDATKRPRENVQTRPPREQKNQVWDMSEVYNPTNMYRDTRLV